MKREDFAIDIMIGRRRARSTSGSSAYAPLITTRAGMLTAPLRDRAGGLIAWKADDHSRDRAQFWVEI